MRKRMIDPITSPEQPTVRPGIAGRAVIIIATIAVALLAIGAFRLIGRRHHDAALAEEARTESSKPAAVDVVRVVRAGAAEFTDLPGTASPFYETTVFARTSGYLKEWKHDIGDRVKAGEVLATIETPELDDQLRAANAKVIELEAEVALARAGSTFAKVSYARWNADGPAGVVSEQEKDSKKADYDSAIAHVQAAEASVQLGQAEVDRLQTLEKFKRVVAPFDGVITERHVDIGDLVTAGSTASTTPLFQIAQYTQLRVFVEVPQGLSRSINDGMPVTAYAPDSPTARYSGKVDRTAGAIDPASRMLKVEVLVDNPDLSLLPGTYLQVQFHSMRVHPPLQIPAAAMTMRPEGPESAVVADDGAVTFHKLDIGQDLGDFLEIDHGLTEGDRVVMNIGEDVIDGSHVATTEIDTGPPTSATTRPAVALR